MNPSPNPKRKPRRKLNHLAAKAIEELERKSGGAFGRSPFFLEYVLELEGLGIEACTDSKTQTTAQAFDAPTVLGDLVLFPLSIGSRFWLLEIAFPALADDAQLQEVAVAFAMSKRGARLCHDLPSPKEARRAVKTFARGLTVSDKALRVTLERLTAAEARGSVNADGSPLEDEDRSYTFGPTVALLCREYGESRDYWLFEASEDFLGDVLNDYKSRVSAQWAAQGHNVSEIDPSWEGFRAFRNRVAEILEEVLEGEGNRYEPEPEEVEV